MLTAPADGQSLDTIIGELQSNYGVPAYPQEYRITIKVAEEKSSSQSGGGGGGGNGASSGRAPATPAADGAPKREKAPAAPRVSPEGGEEPAAEGERPARKRRSRRRRGKGRSGGNGSGPPGGDASSGPATPPPSTPPPPPPPPA